MTPVRKLIAFVYWNPCVFKYATLLVFIGLALYDSVPLWLGALLGYVLCSLTQALQRVFEQSVLKWQSGQYGRIEGRR